MTKWTVEISIGPIQQFVGQSRRTRDLWGSSYLLSYLCAHAAVAAAENGARVLQPDLDANPFCQLVTQVKNDAAVTGDAPAFASVPNHLVMETSHDPQQVAEAAREGLHRAWQKVADTVWENFVAPYAHLGNGTHDIWQRQVKDYWEFMWVASQDGEVPGLLTRRKLLRDHQLPVEPGDMCMVMPDFQELSGYGRPGGREEQKRFWEALRERVGPFNLRPGERLCAIALIKRLYPLVAEAALGWEINMSRWPSSVDISAMPWLEQVGAVAADQAAAYAKLVAHSTPQAGDYPDTAPVRKQGPYERLMPESVQFARLHPNYLYRNFVKDPRLCPLQDDGSDVRAQLLKQLGELQERQSQDGQPLGAPVFYALLLADGDRLGEVLGRLDRTRVGQALVDFTNQVREIVERQDGFVVYAGGDDVLAMLPVPKALTCADQLATAYQEAFQKVDSQKLEKPPTLSVAVLFTHMTLALTTALREAHRLLDEVAKDGNHRASLAVEVLKRGGATAQWVSHWKRGESHDLTSATACLDDLVIQLRDQPYTTLLYRMRQVLIKILGWWDWRPGASLTVSDDIDLTALLQAEICSSLDHSDQQDRSEQDIRNDAAQLARKVTELLRPAYGPDHVPDHAGQLDRSQIRLDALPLARFLATGGREEEHAW